MLLLQREQMLEAQEMFRTANKVTRPEKALILGFMAGSRGIYADKTIISSHQKYIYMKRLNHYVIQCFR